MRRRALLVAVSTGLTTAVAGCSGGGGDSENTDGGGGDSTDQETDTPTPEPNTDTDTPTPAGEPEFEVVEIDAPEEVEINEEWSWSVTVENVGDADGTFESEVLGATNDQEAESLGTIELDIPAGETRTFESSTSSVAQITRVAFSLEAVGEEFTVQVLSRQLTFGESYTSPNQIRASALGIDLRDAYEYEDYAGDTATEGASDGMQWAFVDFEAENQSGSSEFIPLQTGITIRADESQYDYEITRRENGQYEGGEVGPGVVREGFIAYEIPADLGVSDLTVEWFESTVRGDYGVRWSES